MTRTFVKCGASFTFRISDTSGIVLRLGFRVGMEIRVRLAVVVRVKIKVRGDLGIKRGLVLK